MNKSDRIRSNLVTAFYIVAVANDGLGGVSFIPRAVRLILLIMRSWVRRTLSMKRARRVTGRKDEINWLGRMSRYWYGYDALGYIMYGKRTIWDFKPNKKRKIAFLCRWNWFIYSFLIHRIPYESSLCGGILAWPLYLLCFSSEFLGSIISGDMNTVDQFRSKEKFSLNINLAKESDFDADIRDTTIWGWLAGCDVERYTLWKRVSIYFLH